MNIVVIISKVVEIRVCSKYNVTCIYIVNNKAKTTLGGGHLVAQWPRNSRVRLGATVVVVTPHCDETRSRAAFVELSSRSATTRRAAPAQPLIQQDYSHTVNCTML